MQTGNGEFAGGDQKVCGKEAICPFACQEESCRCEQAHIEASGEELEAEEEEVARNCQETQSTLSFSYGGNFPVVGTSYKMNIPARMSSLQFLNKLTKLIFNLGEIVLSADGGFHRPGSEQPLFPIGKIDLRWRYESHCDRYIIDFFRKGKLLSWRWDELRPTTDPHLIGVVPRLICIGHVGNRVFHYSLDSGLSSTISQQNLTSDDLMTTTTVMNDSPAPMTGSTRRSSFSSVTMSTHLAALNAATSGIEAILDLQDQAAEDGQSFQQVFK
mmetsp:Transcript_40417/g.75676  ORF Transcript_40417/g.75676 Transcript_40417/m.75676 type:complete len:272 (-) Transcript_40417:49-864(-)